MCISLWINKESFLITSFQRTIFYAFKNKINHLTNGFEEASISLNSLWGTMQKRKCSIKNLKLFLYITFKPMIWWFCYAKCFHSYKDISFWYSFFFLVFYVGLVSRVSVPRMFLSRWEWNAPLLFFRREFPLITHSFIGSYRSREWYYGYVNLRGYYYQRELPPR